MTTTDFSHKQGQCDRLTGLLILEFLSQLKRKWNYFYVYYMIMTTQISQSSVTAPVRGEALPLPHVEAGEQGVGVCSTLLTLGDPPLETFPQSLPLYLLLALGQVVSVGAVLTTRFEGEDLISPLLQAGSAHLLTVEYPGGNDVEHCRCAQADQAGQQGELHHDAEHPRVLLLGTESWLRLGKLSPV